MTSNHIESSMSEAVSARNGSANNAEETAARLCVQHMYSEPSVYEGKTISGHSVANRIHLQSESNPNADNWVAYREVPDEFAGGKTFFDIKLTDGKLDPAAKNVYFDYLSRETGKDELYSSDKTNYPKRPVSENSKEYKHILKILRSVDFDRLPECQIQDDSEGK
jgi:hypothetical protein